METSQLSTQFLEEEEKHTIDEFLEKGYCIFPIEDRPLLDCLRDRVFDFALQDLAMIPKPSLIDFFDHTERYIELAQLNEIRVSIIRHINNDEHFRPVVYRLARKYLWWLVGSELAMQNAINISIQLPQDGSSLLPVHSDVWSGDSPYEIVFWLPFVSCYKTKSMFILPREKSMDLHNHFESVAKKSANALLDKIREDVIWLDVPYGHGVLFSHTVLHGNVTNEESETRWTMNVRFKSLLTPYGDQALGKLFSPITLRPATKIGYQYVKPST